MATNKKPWKVYLCWILGTEAVGALSGFLTREGMRLYKESIQKPPLSPPSIVFPLVWAVLFALMGFGAARIYLSMRSAQRSRCLYVYVFQLAVNFFWSIFFFSVQAFGFAFFWLLLLWGLIFIMILEFKKLDSFAGKIQIPYLLWVSFAAYLNAGVWLLNR